MILIISLIYVLLLVTFLHKKIKKRPAVLYLVPLVIIALGFTLFAIQANEVMPEWAWMMIVTPFQTGSFSFAVFSVIMYAGALDRNRKWVRNVLGIRTQLSIFGSIFVYFHIIFYGLWYVPALFGADTLELSFNEGLATGITMVNAVVLTFLFVTSFKSVKKRMKAVTWASVQKLAYVFYTLVYLHVMVIFSEHLSENLFGIIIYSVVFFTYVVLRLRKAGMDRKVRGR